MLEDRVADCERLVDDEYVGLRVDATANASRTNMPNE